MSEEIVVDQYARAKPNVHSPALFNDDGDARWITIGSKDSGGESHGGHHVKISKDGTMLTGHFAGKKVNEAFGTEKSADLSGPKKTISDVDKGNRTKEGPSISAGQQAQRQKMAETMTEAEIRAYFEAQGGDPEKTAQAVKETMALTVPKRTSMHSGDVIRARHAKISAAGVKNPKSKEILDGVQKYLDAGGTPRYRGEDQDQMSGLTQIAAHERAVAHTDSVLNRESPWAVEPQTTNKPLVRNEDRVNHADSLASSGMPQEEIAKDLASKGVHPSDARRLASDASYKQSDKPKPFEPIADKPDQDVSPESDLSSRLSKMDLSSGLSVNNIESLRRDMWEKHGINTPKPGDIRAMAEKMRQSVDVSAKPMQTPTKKKPVTPQVSWDNTQKPPYEKPEESPEWKKEEAHFDKTIDSALSTQTTQDLERAYKFATDESQKAKQSAENGKTEQERDRAKYESAGYDFDARQLKAELDKRSPQAANEAPKIPAASPGIIAPPTSVPNEAAKAGDQLGLFGEADKPAYKKPMFKPTLPESTGKQGGLFDTTGNMDQMDLFGGAGIPDEMVYKPQPKQDDDSDLKKKDERSLLEKQAERAEAAKDILPGFELSDSPKPSIDSPKPSIDSPKPAIDSPKPVSDSGEQYPKENPFRLKADEIRRKAESLSPGGSARDKAMKSAFPFGTGRPGNASSQRTSKQSDARMDKSIDDAKKALTLFDQAKAMDSRADSFDAGHIDENGFRTESGKKIDQERADKKQAAQDTKATATEHLHNHMRETFKPGQSVFIAANPSNAVEIKRVNAKSITTTSGSTWKYDELIPPSADGTRAMTNKEMVDVIKARMEPKEESKLGKVMYGDAVKTPDGKIGIMAGQGGMGSDRVAVHAHDGSTGYYSRDELTKAAKEDHPETHELRKDQWGQSRFEPKDAPPVSDAEKIEQGWKKSPLGSSRELWKHPNGNSFSRENTDVENSVAGGKGWQKETTPFWGMSKEQQDKSVEATLAKKSQPDTNESGKINASLADVKVKKSFEPILPESTGKATATSQESEFGSFDAEKHGDYRNLLKLGKKIDSGELNHDEFKAAHKLYTENGDAYKADLMKRYNAQELKNIAANFGDLRSRDNKKEENAHSIYEALMQNAFDVGDGMSRSWGMSELRNPNARIERLAKHVEKQTPETLAAHVEKAKASQNARETERAAERERLSNPQSLEDYRQLIRATDGGYSKLESKHQEAYDSLMADKSRSERNESKKPSEVKQLSGEGKELGFDLTKNFHSKRGQDIFTATPNIDPATGKPKRVSDEDYREMTAAAKQLGGWYYKKFGNTPEGFHFPSEEARGKFLELQKGSVDRSDQLEERKKATYEKTADRLTESADRITERAQEELSRERKTNTAKRAGEAASANANARKQVALGETLKRVADHIATGNAKHLTGIKHGTHIQALNQAISEGKYGRWQAQKDAGNGQGYEKFMEQDDSAEDIRHVEYPHPKIWTHDLREIASTFEDEPGLKKIAAKMKSWGSVEPEFKKSGNNKIKFSGGELVSPSQIAEAVKGGEILKRHVPVGHSIRVHKIDDARVAKQVGRPGPFYTADGGKTVADDPTTAVVGAFNKGHALDTLEPPEEKRLTVRDPDAIATMQEALSKLKRRSNPKLRRAADNLAWSLEKHNRMKAADIHNVHELRSALREFMPLRKKQEQEDPIKKAERGLVGRKIDGFFPTPRSIIDQMLDHADIQKGHSVLEPSAGKGDILDAVNERHSEDELSTHALEIDGSLRDLLKLKGHNIVGNNFMEHSGNYDRILMNPPFEKGQDMAHVKHAFGLLKPGGKLVAIMAHGGTGKRNEFDQWVHESGGEVMPLDQGSFNNDEAFRKTGVNTKMVVLTKPSGESAEKYHVYSDLRSWSERWAERYENELEPLIYDERAENRARELYNQVSAIVDRYEWNESLHPRHPGGSARGGQFSTKTRDLPDHPGLDSAHSMHITNQDGLIRQNLSDWSKGLYRMIANSHRMQGSGADVSEEQLWAGINKDDLRKQLDYMNKLDKHHRENGGPSIANLVNANGLIPKMIAERLHGGSRFFDIRKLRGKLGVDKPAEQPQDQPDTNPNPTRQIPTNPDTGDQFDKPASPDQQQANLKSMQKFPSSIANARTSIQPSPPASAPEHPDGVKRITNDEAASGNWDRFHAGLASEYVQSKIVRGMKGIEGREYGMRDAGDGKWQMVSRPGTTPPSSAGPSDQSPGNQLPGNTGNADQSQGNQGNTTQKLPDNSQHYNGGLSKQRLANLNKAISSLIGGDNADMVDEFRDIVMEAWKQKRQEAADHNEAIRTITGAASKLADAKGGQTTPQALSALVRAARNRTLDPSRKRGFDEMVDSAERSFPHLLGGKGEEGLMELLQHGVKPDPDVMDEDVIQHAVSMAGPNFFGSHDDGESFDDADSTNWDSVPFSWIAAKAIVEVMRYAGRGQMEFNWDESKHPREPAGAVGSIGGEFTRKEEGIDRGYRSVVSGAQSSPSDIAAYKLSDRPIGVSVQPRPISARVVGLLALHAETGKNVFLDSGIASTVSKGQGVDFSNVFKKYKEILEEISPSHRHRVMVVAPDHLEKTPTGEFRGDQAKTLDLQHEWSRDIKEIQDMGASVIVPVQRGDLGLAEAASLATDTIDFSNGKTIFGIPYNKGAWDDQSILDFAKSSKGNEMKLHLLGGGKQKVEALTKRLHEIDPDMVITGDAASELRNRNRKKVDEFGATNTKSNSDAKTPSEAPKTKGKAVESTNDKSIGDSKHGIADANLQGESPIEVKVKSGVGPLNKVGDTFYYIASGKKNARHTLRSKYLDYAPDGKSAPIERDNHYETLTSDYKTAIEKAKKILAKNGIDTLYADEFGLNDADNPRDPDVFKFGKYEGKKISEVDDPAYIQWAWSQAWLHSGDKHKRFREELTKAGHGPIPETQQVHELKAALNAAYGRQHQADANDKETTLEDVFHSLKFSDPVSPVKSKRDTNRFQKGMDWIQQEGKLWTRGDMPESKRKINDELRKQLRKFIDIAASRGSGEDKPDYFWRGVEEYAKTALGAMDGETETEVGKLEKQLREAEQIQFDKLNAMRGDKYSGFYDPNRDIDGERSCYAGKDQMSWDFASEEEPTPGASSKRAVSQKEMDDHGANGRLRIKGTTDDHTQCERCGRSDLKSTVVVETLDAEGNGTGELHYYGSDCISKIMGKSSKAIMDKALLADHVARVKKTDDARKLQHRPKDNAWEANLAYKTTNRKSIGSYLARNDSGKVVRVDGNDPEDVKFWDKNGFTNKGEPITEHYSHRSNPMLVAIPTEAQREAGNYRMAHLEIHGLKIAIETPKGRKRRPEWPAMAAHYGYIKSTKGNDGDSLDVFVGPNLESEIVYVVDQSKLNGQFDEHKAMIGFDSRDAAVKAYRDSYTSSWKVGPVTSMTIEQFKAWIDKGNLRKPVHLQVSRYSAESGFLVGCC